MEAKICALTDNYRFKEHFRQPQDIEKSITRMRTDLRNVPVLGKDDRVTDVLSKFQSDTTLADGDKQLIWQCLALARDAFLRLEDIDPCSGKVPSPGGYQWNMNWKHVRAEIDQVLEASKLLGLSASYTRDAILASIFSDSIKTPRNFIVHHIHGAYGAAQALSYFLDANVPENLACIERVARAVREHQIAPPEFMARIVSILLRNKLKAQNAQSSGTAISAPQEELICQIYRKIADPLNKAHLNDDLTHINFSEEERELLALIDLPDWYVPHPDNPDSVIAHAVIAGDHSINYNHPEGFAKIALIRGPDTDVIFEDPTVFHSLDSAVNSFADSFRVIRPEVHMLAINGLRRTKTAMERVTAIMRELFNGCVIGAKEIPASGIEKVVQAIHRAHDKYPELFTVEHRCISEAGKNYTERAIGRLGKLLQEWFDNHGGIPFNTRESKEGEPGPLTLPYWNTPLKYPQRDQNGQIDLHSLSELEQKQFAFAERIREIAVELLRAEQWIF